jgi:hypothetical protein
MAFFITKSFSLTGVGWGNKCDSISSGGEMGEPHIFGFISYKLAAYLVYIIQTGTLININKYKFAF